MYTHQIDQNLVCDKDYPPPGGPDWIALRFYDALVF